jgi:hypothetical protein
VDWARDARGDRKLFRSNEIDRVGGSNPFIGYTVFLILGEKKRGYLARARDRATQYHDGYTGLSSRPSTAIYLNWYSITSVQCNDIAATCQTRVETIGE